MVKFIESKIAPNPREYNYWVDLTENPNFGVIKYFDGSQWKNITLDEENTEIQNIKQQLNNKVDKVSGKQLSTEDFTTALKNKLNSIEEGATKTVVDSQMSASSTNPVQNKVVQAAINAVSSKVDNIIEDAPEAYDTLKEISDYISTHETEYDALLAISNNKVDKVTGKQLSTNDYTNEEKTKLAGIAANANNYVHPTTAGNKHIPAGGTVGQILVNNGDGTVEWQDKQTIDTKVLEDLNSYGVEWDSTVSDPTLTRIGNPFLHKSLPIQSQYKGCVANGSVINYYLDPNDWSKKVDGTESILDGTDGTVRIHIPKFYGKSGIDGTKRWVKISTMKIDDTWTEIPEMLVDAYPSTVDTTVSATPKAVSVVNTTTQFRGGNNASANDSYLESDPFRSNLGKPRTNISRANMRTYATNAGSEMLCYEYYKWIFYWAWVIEYATFNSQAAYNAELTADGYRQGGLGNGVTNMNNWNEYNGTNPITPCGYCNEIGNFTGIKEIPTAQYTYDTINTTSINSYSKNTSAATMTGTDTITISNVLKANTAYLYTSYTKQTGTVVYTISGLTDGQTIEFYTNNQKIATASANGDISVTWSTETLSNRELRSQFTGECNISISIKSSTAETITLTRPILSVPRWRGFDNPFGDIWINLDGIILKRDAANEESAVYTTTDSSEFGDDETAISNMTIAGTEVAQDSYIKDFDLGENGNIIPSAVGGSATTYMCDYHYCNASSTSLRTLFVGGHSADGSYAGLGFFGSANGVGAARSYLGFRTLNLL